MPQSTFDRARPRRLVVALLLGGLLLAARGSAQAEDPEDPSPRGAIRNPYFEKTEWKVWRDDDSPVEGVQSMVREGKEKKVVPVTIQALPPEKRIYPVEPGSDGPYIAFKASA